MADDDFCYLCTTGRVSGRPHRIEIWYAREADTLYLLAGGGHDADWVRNLSSNPDCRVELGDAEHQATARLLDRRSPESERARNLVFEKYQARYGGDLTDWRERALPVAIDLARPAP